MDWRRTILLCAGLVLLAGSASCQAAAQGTAGQNQTPAALVVTSALFTEGGLIPPKYTCDGENVSPALAWTGVPPEAKSLALIVDDPDAPVGTWVHWVTFDLPADLSELAEGAPEAGTAGASSFNQPGYGGPCPPSGTHRYFFKVYALDTRLDLADGANKAEVEKAMQGHVLAQGQLMGTYKRTSP